LLSDEERQVAYTSLGQKLPSTIALYFMQGKGLQKTFWLDGREGLSLPLLRHSHEELSLRVDDVSALGVQTVDE